jgi:WD40 repeat protein
LFLYLLRLTLWLALSISILSLLMPTLGQMNPRRDWIVYISGRPGPETVNLHDLERHFSTPISGIPPSYTMAFNAQSTLAFVANGMHEVQVFDLRSLTSKPQVIYTSQTNVQFFRFEWSPDGRFLAFLGFQDSQLYVWDGESVITLNPFEPAVHITDMVWSPDNRLVFTLRPEGRPYLHELYFWNGQQTIDLIQTPDKDENLATWSRDGRLAYTSQGINLDDPSSVMIWDGIKSVVASSDVGTVNWMAWNTEDNLVFGRTRSGYSQLYRWDGKQVINISPDSQKSYSYQTWNRDGRWAVSTLSLLDGSTENIQVRNIHQQVLLDVSGILYPIWTEAGSLLFCQRQPQGVVLQRWDAERIRPVTQGSVIYTLVPNGMFLHCE